MKIFITHLHGDHVLGLPGLLQTMALMDRKASVQVFGPVGLRNFLVYVKETLNFGLTFPVEISEISEEGIICEEEKYWIKTIKTNHSIESYAYAFEEKPRPGKFYPKKALTLGVTAGVLWSKLQRGEEIKLSDGKVIKPNEVMGPMREGRKIIYTGDTRPFEAFLEFAADADLIIHDCTFDNSLSEKAETDGHSTPSQAAGQAKIAGAKMLVLSHISARYPNGDLLLEQAQKIFSNSVLAQDFMEIELVLGE